MSINKLFYSLIIGLLVNYVLSRRRRRMRRQNQNIESPQLNVLPTAPPPINPELMEIA